MILILFGVSNGILFKLLVAFQKNAESELIEVEKSFDVAEMEQQKEYILEQNIYNQNN